jgi:hypothetical protein
MDSFARHEDDLLGIEEPGEEPAAFDADARAELREYYGDGPEGAVLPVLAARHAQRLSERLPNITHYAKNATHPEFPLALLAWGTRLAEGIRVRHRDSVIFDDGYQVWAMDVVELVLAAQIGDFEVDVLCRWTSRGPPHQADTDAGHRYREITRECAVLTGSTDVADLRRSALEHSFRMLVVSCDTAELERDPFAVAYRVLNELRIRTHDDTHGPDPDPV